MKTIVSFGVVLALLLVSVGSLAFAQEEITLTYWDTARDEERAVWDPLWQACAEEQGVNLASEFVPFADAQNAFKVAAQGGNAPDIMRSEIAWTPEYAALGFLADLTDMVSEEDQADYMPAAFGYNVWNDRIWGVPQVTDAPALLYNKAMFEAAGLEAPTTTDELEEAAAALTSDDVVGIALPFGVYAFLPYVFAFGGGLIDSDDLEIHINDPGTVEAFNFMLGLIEDGSMPGDFDPPNQYSNSQNAFKEGRAAMLVNGPWAVPDILTGPAFEDPANLGIAPFPAGPDGGQGSPVGGHNYTIYAGSAFIEEAYRLIECVNSTQSQVTLALELGLLPTRQSAYADEDVQNDPIISAFGEQMAVATGRPAIPEGGMIFTSLDTHYSAAILGAEDPQEAMDAVAADWRSLLGQ